MPPSWLLGLPHHVAWRCHFRSERGEAFEGLRGSEVDTATWPGPQHSPAPGVSGEGLGLPVAPVKTSPWAGLSEMTAVASTVDARSKVRAPEVVICPEGVTVTAKEPGLSPGSSGSCSWQCGRGPRQTGGARAVCVCLPSSCYRVDPPRATGTQGTRVGAFRDGGESQGHLCPPRSRCVPLTGRGRGGRKQRDVLGGLLLHGGARQLVLLLAPLVGDEQPHRAALGQRWGWGCRWGEARANSNPPTPNPKAAEKPF